MSLLHDNMPVDVVSAFIIAIDAVVVVGVVVFVVEPRLARDAYKIQFEHYDMIHLNCVQTNCLHDMLHFVWPNPKQTKLHMSQIHLHMSMW